jgi:hypothetical protein
MFDTAVRGMSHRPDIYAAGLWQDDFRPYWDRDIRPIIERVRGYQWVAAIPRHAHELEIEKLGDPDPRYRSLRQFYLGLVRPPDAPNLENSTDNGLPLMPMLCGDNCLTNIAPSKFLRLTDTMLFLLGQWAEGLFVDERREGIDPGPQLPGPGAALDRGVLASALGGSFCPGGEATWIMRNPAIYREAYRINPNQNFLQPVLKLMPALSLQGDLATGLEPGDITKYSGVPWQSDFNECSTQEINITYEDWNNNYLASTGDPAQETLIYTYWWPAHRPMMVFKSPGGPQVYWSQGVPQTNLGDLKMVTAWKELGFVKNNPEATPDNGLPLYVLVESENIS